MITAMVTRDLALPAPSVAAQSPLLLASTTSATTCGALRMAMSSPARFQRHPKVVWTAL